MNKDFVLKSKEKLEEQKKSIEKELSKFAKKDNNLKGDWDTSYPNFENNSIFKSQQLEEAADEVEEYANLLPIEHSLETRLQKINSALSNIKEGKYGICKKCQKEISKERLEAYPEADLCSECQK